MAESIVPQLESRSLLRLGSPGARLARRVVFGKLRQLGEGRLTIVDGDGRHEFGASPKGADFSATIDVNADAFYESVLTGGTIGAAESYMRGEWSSPDLTAVVRLLVRNRAAMEGLEGGLASLAKPFLKLFHLMRRNSLSGSRKNIVAHYDLGNDFYELFLDRTMCYSSGVFLDEGTSLEEASIEKMDRLCRKLALEPGHHLLEIGTGWGGLAIHAAKNYGCRVTTTTISPSQYEYARRRVEREGLAHLVDVQLKDYRELEGSYDRIVSVEMIEAVGWQYYQTFMAKCTSLLRPDGLMALQSITIRDNLYEQAKRSVDFIQRYIFPGSCIPSTTALLDAASKASDFSLIHQEDFGTHYARTLKEWRTRFQSKLDKVREQGFSEEFIRMWDFYLCYCEGGFAERNIGVCHLVLARPGCRQEPILG